LRAAPQERGQALVEFVVILPVFLAIVLGLIEFGKALNYWIDMTHLANEGARYSTVNRWPTCPSDDASACSDTLTNYLLARVNTDELRDGGSPNVPNALGVDICFPVTADKGEPVRVTISSEYRLPLLNAIFGWTGADSIANISLEASSTQRLERTPTANRLLAEDSGTCA
jgi:Flp pilus assembly protein TadG